MSLSTFPRGMLIFIAFLCYRYYFSGLAAWHIDQVGSANFVLGSAKFAPGDAGAEVMHAPLGWGTAGHF